MRRVEIMAAQALQEDMLEALEEAGIPSSYTILPVAYGRGRTDPKLGDSVWPEENFVLIIYCDARYVPAVESAVQKVQQRYDHEGIGLFIL